MTFQHALIISRDERILAAHAASIPLPVQPADRERVDEKYSLRGYNSLDARSGTDWGGNNNDLCCGGRQD